MLNTGWKRLMFALFILFFLSSAYAQITVNAVRTFSQSTYLPGQSIDVTLAIEITGMPTAVIINETIPETWQITSSNLPINSFIAPSTYKWLQFNATGVSSVEIKYSVSIPEDATGDQSFTGLVEYLENETMITTTIGGQTTITLPPSGFGISPQSLHFGTTDTSATVTLSNLGGSSINWTSSIATDDGITGWLKVSPNSGTIAAGSNATATVQITRSLLTTGSHTGSITFTANTSPETSIVLRVSAIAGSPSPVSNFTASALFNSILLSWENPSSFTGTIIFRKNVPLSWDDKPVNGTSYTIGSRLPGGAICVFKDTVNQDTSFIDDTAVETSYYRIFSFDDGSAPSYYPLYSEKYSDSPSTGIIPLPIEVIWEGDDLFTETQVYNDPYGYNLLAKFNTSGVSEADPKVYVGYVPPDYIPPKLTSVTGFKNTYLLSSNFTLNPGDTVDIRIPVRLDELATEETSVTLYKTHVYHWPGANNKWEDITSQVIERNLSQMYITVRLNGNQLKGNDYFSLGIPQPSVGSGGGCFIATAAYGTPFAKEINVLRKFRDQKLLKTKIGSAFVKFYYRHSPPIASFIKDKPVLRAFVRGILKPIVWLCGKFVV